MAVKGHGGTERYEAIRRVTVVGAIADFLLGVIKLSVGWLANSQSLIADGVHSLSDLSTDVLVLYIARHSHQDADAAHPYGHARFETVATVGLGLALILVAVGIGIDSVRRLMAPDDLAVPGALALFAAALSVVTKEAIYHYTMRYARRFHSSLLRANAWHSRSDALSSIVVIIGVGAAMAGLPMLDTVAAVIVAVMIGKIGWSLAWKNIEELVDTGLDQGEVDAIEQMIKSVDGVAELHMLRTRRMGGKALVDVHILLDDPRISVSEGHQISETVRGRLISERDEVMDVTVHIDPEDDEEVALAQHLPLRTQVLETLEPRWQSLTDFTAVRRFDLHYLDGKVHVTVCWPASMGGDDRDVRRRRVAEFQNAAGDIDWLGRVTSQYVED